ncbi:MAG: aspartate-semialdehyde dehydrogenase [Calditrichia bacterium]
MQKKSGYKIIVAGATGLVGRKMVQVLEERQFPVRELALFASERSAGARINFRGNDVAVKPLGKDSFHGADIALFSAGATVSREFAPIAAQQDVVVIDNSSAWRMEPEIPLVVPEVNPQMLHNHKHIIANPNCSTIQLVVALQPLQQHFGIRRVVVSTYQSVSGSGKRAMQQLEDEIQHGQSDNPYYPHPIAFNCLPQIDEFLPDGYTREEMKMINETRKILSLPELAITATTVRVPVHVGHSESVNVELEKEFSLEEVCRLFSESPGLILEDEPADHRYPMPLLAMDRDEVFIGRLRRDLSRENGLNFWIVADNLRKGAATNAVQIAELLIK